MQNPITPANRSQGPAKAPRSLPENLIAPMHLAKETVPGVRHHGFRFHLTAAFIVRRPTSLVAHSWFLSLVLPGRPVHCRVDGGLDLLLLFSHRSVVNGPSNGLVDVPPHEQ